MPAALPIAAGIGAIGSIAGGILGNKAAKKASQAEVQSNKEALALQKYMYDTARGDYQPYREAGSAAIGQGYDMLQPGYDYTASPGYQFRLGEGINAIQGSAASRGGLLTGGTLKDILRYSQGLAASDYGDQFNRTMAVAGGGQQAVQGTANAGANYANQGQNAYQSIGQAKASGYAGQNQAVQGTIGNLFNLASMYGGGFGGGSGGFNPGTIQSLYPSVQGMMASNPGVF